MKKKLKEIYADRQPIGVYSDTAFSGYNFYIPIEYDPEIDFIVCRVISGKKTFFRKEVVHYTRSGNGYIIRDGNIIYLSKVMRIY